LRGILFFPSGFAQALNDEGENNKVNPELKKKLKPRNINIMNITAILSVTLILFSVIDIIGSLPVLINMKREGLKIRAGIATFSAASIMLLFFF